MLEQRGVDMPAWGSICEHHYGNETSTCRLNRGSRPRRPGAPRPRPLTTNTMAEAAPALSEYEQLRVANILRNAAELKRLGLDVAAHTMAALGKQAPTARTQKRAVRPKGAPPTRRSLRAAKLPAPEYKEPTGSAARALDAEVDDEGRVAAPGGRRKRAKTEAYAPPANPSSIKNLDVDLDGLRERYLGKIIPPMGGQVKRAVMEAASAGGPPTFSRMSGIQEWRNCVMLFVNVYGEGYKNSFVGGGTEITWFAQPRQWEAAWKPNLQPDFNVSVRDRFDAISSAVLRELDESNRSVQKLAESTSM